MCCTLVRAYFCGNSEIDITIPGAERLIQGNGLFAHMQGGFLLFFDAAMLLVHKTHWKKNEQKMREQLEFNGTSQVEYSI